MPPDIDFDIVIVGGGLTGLSTAFYAKQQLTQADRAPKIVLLEASGRVGGKIRSELVDIGAESPALLEWGADSMLSTKPEGLELAGELGLNAELIETRRERQIFMLRNNVLVPMPEGLQLVVPKRLRPFLTSPLFSWNGKLRMALDLILPRRTSTSDESIAAFMKRRLGQEALDLLAEPILSGIYSADPAKQSLQATFPQLAQLETKHRSLIIGALRSPAQASVGARRSSLFVSFKHGMQTLTNALAKTLDSDIRLNTSVRDISLVGPSKFLIHLTSGETITARSVIVTTPARVSSKILASAAPRATHILEGMRQTSSGCAYLLYDRKEVPHPLSGYGILIPKVENRKINAVTWVSSKMEGRTPPSHVLFRAFFGGERHPDMMQLSDDEIARIASSEIAHLHNIDASPQMTRVFRAENGNPQYDVGHLDRISELESVLPPGLIVTGCAMRGVGIPDCIKQGKQAAILGATNILNSGFES